MDRHPHAHQAVPALGHAMKEPVHRLAQLAVHLGEVRLPDGKLLSGQDLLPGEVGEDGPHPADVQVQGQGAARLCPGL